MGVDNNNKKNSSSNKKCYVKNVPMLFLFFVIGVHFDWCRTYYYGITGGFLMNCATSTSNTVSFQQTAVETTATTTTSSRKAKLADGCHHVFMDVGANVGVHGRFLYEPTKYPKAKYAHEVFEKQFNTPEHRDNRDICVFEFEPNPVHAKKIKQNQDAYKAMGWRYQYIPVGVSDEDGHLEFTHLNDGHYNEWGFSAFNAKQSNEGNQTTGSNNKIRTELIPIVRLVSWIKENVVNRTLPATVYGNYTSDDPRVVMKLDIEGMEMKVLPDLLLSGVFCHDLDFVFGEAHNQKRFYPMTFGDVKFNKGRDGITFYRQLLHAIQIAQPNCRGNFANRDDESYLLDKVELPAPP